MTNWLIMELECALLSFSDINNFSHLQVPHDIPLGCFWLHPKQHIRMQPLLRMHWLSMHPPVSRCILKLSPALRKALCLPGNQSQVQHPHWLCLLAALSQCQSKLARPQPSAAAALPRRVTEDCTGLQQRSNGPTAAGLMGRLVAVENMPCQQQHRRGCLGSFLKCHVILTNRVCVRVFTISDF